MLKILISTDTRYPVNRKIIRQAVSDVFAKNKIETLNAEVSISVIGSRKMKDLSSKYLGEQNTVHDVLSFSQQEISQNISKGPDDPRGFVNPPDDILRLGDVVLCWPEVLDAASQDDIMVDEEVYNLTCHGVEHLLGNHHEEQLH